MPELDNKTRKRDISFHVSSLAVADTFLVSISQEPNRTPNSNLFCFGKILGHRGFRRDVIFHANEFFGPT